MIVLERKKILVSLAVTAVAIFCFTIQNMKTTANNTVQTVALPISNKVIVIDAGHGIPDE